MRSEITYLFGLSCVVFCPVLGRVRMLAVSFVSDFCRNLEKKTVGFPLTALSYYLLTICSTTSSVSTEEERTA